MNIDVRGPIFEKYRQQLKRNMKRILPQLSQEELDRAIDYSIQKRLVNTKCDIDDNYRGEVYNLDMVTLVDTIEREKPILSSYGCLFHRHGTQPNPLYKMIQEFADRRNRFKKKMLQYPKGSEEYNRYNLNQLVAKVDNNAIYGCNGAPSSVFYNVYVATSITRQGRSSITSSIMLFESFLANNVKFGSLDDVVNFIDHVAEDTKKSTYEDHKILNRGIGVQEVFYKLMDSCGYKWLPNNEEADIIWRLINKVDQRVLNRLYYKNNLYAFFDNTIPMDIIINIMKTLDSPFIDPNKPPKDIVDHLDILVDVIKEYVFYEYQIIDKIERAETLTRKIDLTTDTDSCIITLNPWYEFISSKISNIDLTLRHYDIDKALLVCKDDMNQAKDLMTPSDVDYIYDFRNNEILEKKRGINPIILIPEDGVRYTIINILAYVIGRLLKLYFDRISEINNITNDAHPFCLMNMKNEFLFMKMLLTNAKKHYASLIEIQEGNMIPKDPSKMLDIKGMAMDKSVVPSSTKEVLSRILYEDILKSREIDQVRILNKLAVLEKRICDTIYNGGLDYYKPMKVKPFTSYKNPMSTQQVKASVIYDLFKDDSEPYINIEDNNSVLVIKTIINKNVLEDSKLKTNNPEKYNLMLSYIMDNPVAYIGEKRIPIKLFADKLKLNEREITSVAIPRSLNTPKWLLEFIDYDSIVKENIGAFPLESIGITKLDTNSAYSGIIDL